jgi:putative DNA primase/helicase
MIASLEDMVRKLVEMNNEPINTIDNVEYLRNPNEVPADDWNDTPQEGNNWWKENPNGTRSLKHNVLAEYIIQKYNIVRYPDAHGDLYYYNSRSGLYELDKTCRQLRSFIRNEDELNRNQVREVQDYALDMSPMIVDISKKYFAVNNGLIDLKTLNFKAFTPDEFVIFKIPTNYNPNAYDVFVDDTLNRVTDGYEPSRKNLEEMMGCVFYPKVLVAQIFYLYGKTAHNGKSIILFLIQKTFNYNGGNISAVSPQKLATNTFAGSSMNGKYANIVDDLPDQLIEDSGLLKTSVTGGYVQIEQKGKDSKNVQLFTKWIIASNYYPNFRENGNQINRRLHIIPFEHNFSNDPECLPEIESMERLSSASAREYTLKLAVDAVKRMLASGAVDKLTPNEKAQQAKQDFAEYNDPLTDFFFEYSKEYFEEVRGTDALQAYDQWCRDNHINHPLGAKRFKDSVCTRYDMQWKDKKIKVNGEWKTVKGFKSK